MNSALRIDVDRLDSSRLVLRKPVATDVDGLVEVQCDARVRRFLGGPRSEAQIRPRIEAAEPSELLTETGSFVIADRSTTAMLGIALLGRRDPALPGHVLAGGEELELSYVLRVDAWGKGYATEAARILLASASSAMPDQPVLIVTQSANSQALAVSARLGFRRVRTFHQFGAEQALEVAGLRMFRTAS